MDPLHITEFASDRFYEKLSQLKDAQASPQPEGHAVEGPSIQPPPVPQSSFTQSTFILPLRETKTAELEEPAVKSVEQKRPEKSRFLSFRSKLLPTKSSTTIPTPTLPIRTSTEQVERRTSVADSTKQSLAFDQLFLHLPNELQVQIIASLPLSDILHLRLASRSLHALISLNEAPIVRYHLDHHVPAYAKRLYPVPENTPLNFHYLCGIWHRLHVAAKLSYLICEWVTKEIFLRTTEEKRQEFAPQRERMRRRLIPLLFTVFHFFETYRDLHLKHMEEHGGIGLLKEPYTYNPIEAKIMNMYDDQTLLRVHQIFPLVISSFCRRLRPPSYVGRVEGALRGYLREKAPEEVHVAILCIGGLRQVERFWEVKGYNARRLSVDTWYNTLVEPEAKKRRGLMGLGRKKSSMAIGKQAVHDAAQVTRNSWDASTPSPNFNSFVFNTSLSAGMPMTPLSKPNLASLLSDMPTLQQIWLTTAEAMILDRKIVERPIDIKRNAQVMLELIREDGFEEEDEWWYGSTAPESVRPNLEAIEEDILE